MPTFTLEISTENDAFGFAPEIELARILSDVARALRFDVTAGPCMDINGHRVGNFHFDHNKHFEFLAD